MIFSLYFLDILSVELFHYYPNLPDDILITLAIFGPTLGYFDQLYRMIKTRSNLCFVLESALIMLFTNTLRFIYWTFESYEAYLLGQSVALFLLQFILSILSFLYSESGSLLKEKGLFEYIRSYFRDFHHQLLNFPGQNISYHLHIMKNKNLLDFCMSLLLYLVLIIIAFLLFWLVFGLKITLYIFIYCANIVDTFISFPLFKKVVIKKEIHNISTILIFQNLLGDIMKLILYVFGQSGWSFIFGAILQSFIDLTIYISFCIQSRHHNRDEYDLLISNSNDNLDF